MTIRSLLPVILTACALAATPAARAQTVIATVNDDPVTNIDIEQHTRILKVLHKNATRDAALESIFETRLKLIETAKYKINPTDPEDRKSTRLNSSH